MVLASAFAVLAGCRPPHTWDAHTTSWPAPPSCDLLGAAHERIATLGVVTPGGLQGLAPTLSHALAAALADPDPSVPALSSADTLNALNEAGLAGPYADLLAGFGRSGVLERRSLHALETALGCRWLLLPGLAGLDEVLVDHFEITGLKLVRSRVTTLRLWLQLWNAHTGRLACESSGEARVTSELLQPERTVPLDETAQKLWRRIIREGLLGDRTRVIERRFR
jgi:hypothetical protein